jgi:hypothetical protein
MPRGPGRPKGSVSFPAEKAEIVVELMRGGTMKLKDACVAAGIAYSTARTYIKRAKSDPDCPRKIRDWVRRLEQADSESNIRADLTMHQDHTTSWKRMKQGQSVFEEEDELAPTPDPDRAIALFEEVLWRLLYLEPRSRIPPCPNARCRCIFHRDRSPEGLEATRELAQRREEEGS